MRTRTTLLAAVLVAAGAVAGPGPSAYAQVPGCTPDNPTVGDVDGDMNADLVVGLPEKADDEGAVDLRLTEAPSRLMIKATAGTTQPETTEEFGRAIALADLNDDGCADYVVGAPDTLDEIGAAYLVLGSPTGFVTGSARALDGASTPGDRFGSSVAVARTPSRTAWDVWVGSPDDDPGGVADAGSVAHFRVRVVNGELASTLVETVAQSTPGVPGTAEAGDHFGAVLSATRQGVVVGVPDEDVGSARDAGTVTQLLVDDDDAVDGARTWSQDSPGVPGTAEAGDRFGAAVNASTGWAIAGAPGEDVGARVDAGSVQTFRAGASGLLAPDRSWTQDTTGVPGTAEAGDRFGAAVLIGRNVGCDTGERNTAIGAPGEDLAVGSRTVVDAGAVTVLGLAGPASCALTFDQRGLAGDPERGDAFGTTLALGRHADDHDASDQVFVGVPAEDRGSVVDAGIVQPLRAPTGVAAITVAGVRQESVGYSGGGPVGGMRYGAVLASPDGGD